MLIVIVRSVFEEDGKYFPQVLLDDLNKMSVETFYQKRSDVILKDAKDYYENDKKRIKRVSKNINTKNYLKKKKI